MKKITQWMSLILCLMILLTCVPVQPVSAAPTYKDYVFSDDFDDLSQWTAIYSGKPVEDAVKIVDDPKNPGNKVAFFDKTGAAYVPKTELWPADGQMATVKFRMMFDSKSTQNKTNTSSMFFTFKNWDNYTGTNFCLRYADTNGIWGRHSYRIDGDSTTATGSPQVKPVETTEWMNVEIMYTASIVTITFSDAYENVVSLTANNRILDSMFALGYPSYATHKIYLDDLSVTFSKLSVDVNKVQTDVNTYFSGNTFYEPGDTLSIVGEDLHTTVQSLTIKKLPNTEISSSGAKYIAEQSYEYAVQSNVAWEDIPSVAGSERPLDIVQMTDMDIKVTIPSDGAYATPGMYAILLKAKTAGAKDGIVIVNNPELANIMSNDGGEATTQNGWLKLTGDNLSVQNDASKVSVMILNSDENGGTLLANSRLVVDTTDSEDGRANEYYITVNLPELAPGKYKVMLHNGYGGNYGWSAPYEFTVKAQADYMKWRDLGWFDVTEFGAVGDSHVDDTAAIHSALEAAAQNGGGTVYFPAGYYRITNTLYIPDNVTLRGYDMFHSALFWDSQGWVEVPEYMVLYAGNIEVCDMYFYGSITRNIFGQYVNEKNPPAKKVDCYFHNVKVNFDAVAPVSNARGVMLEGYETLTARLAVAEQSKTDGGWSFFKSSRDYADFVYLDNVVFQMHDAETVLSQNGTTMTAAGQWVYLNKAEWNKWSGAFGDAFTMMERCAWGSGSFGHNGNFFITDSGAKNDVQNNRELINTDGHPQVNNATVQDLNQVGLTGGMSVEELLENELSGMASAEQQKLINQVSAYIAEGRGCVYRLYNANTKFSHTGNTIYLESGQGAGQMRKLKDITRIGEYSYFTVQNPFAVSPNRNTMASIYCYRGNVHVVNSDFENGWRVGTYGTMVDAVYANLSLKENGSGVVLHTNSGQIWYFSVRDTVAKDIITGHTTEIVVKPSGCWNTSASATALSYFGVLFRDNWIGEGGYYTIAGTAFKDGTCNIIFEDNTWVSTMGTGIRTVAEPNTVVDGVYLNRNKQYLKEGDESTLVSVYSESVVLTLKRNAVNKYGYLRYICDEVSPTSSNSQLGDINADGYVSVADLELLRTHLIEKNVLTADQLVCADVTLDGVVDSLDVFALRCLILGIEYDGPSTEEAAWPNDMVDNDGYFDGNY